MVSMNKDANNLSVTNDIATTLPPYELHAQALGDALATLLKEQGISIDNNRLQAALDAIKLLTNQELQVLKILQLLGINDLPRLLSAPDIGYLPLLAFH